MTNSYEPNSSSYREIAEFRSWDLLVHGGNYGLNLEQRSDQPLTKLRRVLPTASFLGTHREEEEFTKIVIDHKNCIQTIFARSFNPDFRDFLQRQGINSQSVLLDISSLELDLILHLLNFFYRFVDGELYALYAAPQDYEKIHETETRVGQINQPPGYVSLRLEQGGSCPRVIITGFDKDRALWFFDAYSRWQPQDCYALIGDPAHVENGTQIAVAANSWIQDIPVVNVLRCDSLDPAATKNILKGLYDRYKRLDVVPLGPKPMVLGMVQFYFSLPGEERNNIRILYDFPRGHRRRTKGIDKLYLINCLAE